MKPCPPCPVCGGNRSLQAFGGGKPNVYACSATTGRWGQHTKPGRARLVMDPIELEHYNKSRLETFSDLKCVEDPRDWDESPGEGWTPELDA